MLFFILVNCAFVVQVATDNYWALKNFFNLYPEYSANEFFITGESYGGIYVPTLSVRVLQDKKINFQVSIILLIL